MSSSRRARAHRASSQAPQRRAISNCRRKGRLSRGSARAHSPRSGRRPSRPGCDARRRRTRVSRSGEVRGLGVLRSGSPALRGLERALCVPHLEQQLAEFAVERGAGRDRELVPEARRPDALLLGAGAAGDSLQLPALRVELQRFAAGPNGVLVLARGRVLTGERRVVGRAGIPRHGAARAPHASSSNVEPEHGSRASSLRAPRGQRCPRAAERGVPRNRPTRPPLRPGPRSRSRAGTHRARDRTDGAPRTRAHGCGPLRPPRDRGSPLRRAHVRGACGALLAMERADELIELSAHAERAGPDVMTPEQLDDRIVALPKGLTVVAQGPGNAAELVADPEFTRDREAHERRCDEASHSKAPERPPGAGAVVVVEALFPDHRASSARPRGAAHVSGESARGVEADCGLPAERDLEQEVLSPSRGHRRRAGTTRGAPRCTRRPSSLVLAAASRRRQGSAHRIDHDRAAFLVAGVVLEARSERERRTGIEGSTEGQADGVAFEHLCEDNRLTIARRPVATGRTKAGRTSSEKRTSMVVPATPIESLT